MHSSELLELEILRFIETGESDDWKATTIPQLISVTSSSNQRKLLDSLVRMSDRGIIVARRWEPSGYITYPPKGVDRTDLFIREFQLRIGPEGWQHLERLQSLEAIDEQGKAAAMRSESAEVAKAGKMVFVTATEEYKATGERWEGAVGTVYAATDSEGKPFAIKVLKTDVSSTKRKRFKNELFFCLKNSHKNIVKVVDHGVILSGQTRTPFYVMPLFAGTLRSLMKQRISPERVLPLFSQILDGVEAAHLKGVCHRDLKPENILFESKSETLVIADFGIAAFREEELYTAVETARQDRLANFLYAAPEQRERGKEVDYRADIFALGLILNEMFTGAVPHGAGFKLVANASQEYSYLDDIVQAMIQQDKEQRPASIEEVKRKIIQTGSEAASLQKLNELKTEVVPADAIDDPLISEPIRIVGTDYRRGSLCFRLSKTPNLKWVNRFQLQGTYQAVLGKEPSRFQFHGDEAIIDAQESQVEQISKFVPKYVSNANEAYKALIEGENEQMRAQRRRELDAAIAEEQKRQRILKKLHNLG
jgi:serine/threonine protein kinase